MRPQTLFFSDLSVLFRSSFSLSPERRCTAAAPRMAQFLANLFFFFFLLSFFPPEELSLWKGFPPENPEPPPPCLTFQFFSLPLVMTSSQKAGRRPPPDEDVGAQWLSLLLSLGLFPTKVLALEEFRNICGLKTVLRCYTLYFPFSICHPPPCVWISTIGSFCLVLISFSLTFCL